jgi:hypothetical protein
MNRFLRRLKRFSKRFSGRRSHGEMSTHEPDRASVRAKSWRHGESTADKWHQ